MPSSSSKQRMNLWYTVQPRESGEQVSWDMLTPKSSTDRLSYYNSHCKSELHILQLNHSFFLFLTVLTGGLYTQRELDMHVT